jgi:hypothetical protein
LSIAGIGLAIIVLVGAMAVAACVVRVSAAFACSLFVQFFTESDGLISYGIDQTELVREAASYIDRILRGVKPAELPVQLPTNYQLVINAKTAAALSLVIPPSMQLLADRVIE